MDCAARMAEFNIRSGTKVLFHGTRTTKPEAIYESSASFDVTFSNEGLWGRGNYFAANASYSDRYSHKAAYGYQQMLVACVLTGYPFFSEPKKFNQPPFRTSPEEGRIRHRYDCVMGNASDSVVYITYDNERAYPAYLITYR